MLDDETAAKFIADRDLLWYQRFNLSPNVVTPGTSASVMEWTLDRLGVPDRLDGLSVLDIGTTNGGAAFIAESRGAQRVVATDLCTPEWFGFDEIKTALGSKVEFIQASVYELPLRLVGERFDVVLFLGVLYHLRHPLLAIDALRELANDVVYVETALSGAPDDRARAEFYRLDAMSGDSTNWFVPTINCVVDWFSSSGFAVKKSDWWPEEQPNRGAVVAHREQGAPEYMGVSYEVPLDAVTRRR